jgi:hypothetical protein
MQGLKPTVPASPMGGTTEVVPCYKAHNVNTLRGYFSFRAGANLDAFALTICSDPSGFAACTILFPKPRL